MMWVRCPRCGWHGETSIDDVRCGRCSSTHVTETVPMPPDKPKPEPPKEPDPDTPVLGIFLGR
jgi:hypothetical protein